jgi:hypothetical protein
MPHIDRLYQVEIIASQGAESVSQGAESVSQGAESVSRDVAGTKKREEAGTKKREEADGIVREPQTKASRILPTRRQIAYAEIRVNNPEIPKTAAATSAGYSPATEPANIERASGFQSLRERLDAAAVEAGITPTGNLLVLKDVMTNTEYPSAQVSAVKVANDMLGYNAPTETHVTHTQAIGLFLARLRDDDIDASGQLRQVEQSTGRLASIRD